MVQESNVELPGIAEPDHRFRHRSMQPVAQGSRHREGIER
jgi:hypothetical protein